MALLGTGGYPVIHIIALGNPSSQVGVLQVDLPPDLAAIAARTVDKAHDSPRLGQAFGGEIETGASAHTAGKGWDRDHIGVNADCQAGRQQAWTYDLSLGEGRAGAGWLEGKGREGRISRR